MRKQIAGLVRAVALAVVAMIAVAVPALAAQAKPVTNPTAQVCTVSLKAGAACAAYLGAAHGALQPYYRFVHSNTPVLKDGRKIFPQIYSPAAQTSILLWAIQGGHAIYNWPAGNNDVRGPNIEILQVVSHPACGMTLLVTRETWQVTGSNNKVLYSESKQIHTVVLGKDNRQVLFVAKGKHLLLAGC